MAKNFAAALEEQLRVSGMSGYRLGQMAGLSKQMVSKLLLAQVQPGWETVAKIAKALGVSCEVFVTDDMQIPAAPDQRPRGRPPKKPAARKKAK